MLAAGVDPGKAGGIVVLDDVGRIVSAQPMLVITAKAGKGRAEYDLEGIRRMLMARPRLRGRCRWSPRTLLVIVERAQPLPPSMPGGGVAQFHRGVSRGMWEGMLAGLGISYELVAPQSWQRSMLAGTSGADTKQRALVAAQRLWPGQDWRANERCRKPHAGIVDAALIAEFGRRRRAGVDAA